MSINPLVATYTKYLNTSAQLTGFLAGMFFFVSLLLKPVTGPAATKLDKRKLLMAAFLIGAVANIGYATFHSVAAFVAFRLLSGAQYSLVGTVLITLAGDHLPADKLAYGLGLYGIAGAIGNAVAPTIGEAILHFGTVLRGESFGFILMFLFGATVYLLIIIPAAMLNPDKKTKSDTASAGAWYKTIFTIHALPPTITMFLLMIPYGLLNTYIFEFGKEQGIEGISAFYPVLAATLAVSRPVSGFLTGKFGVKKTLFPALVIFAAAMLIIGSGRTLFVAVTGAVLAAAGFGASQPALQAMSMQSETSLRRSVASNTIYVGIDLALFLGPYLGGLVYASSDYAVMFKIGAAPVFLAIICLAIILPIHKRRVEELKIYRIL